MASTYSPLKIQLMATGENNTTWGNVTNVNLGTAIEEAIANTADVTFASGNVTLTLTDTNATQSARNFRLNCTGTTGGSTRNLVVPTIEKPYVVINNCLDSILVKTTAGTGITVPAGKSMHLYVDGTNVVDAITHLTSLTLATPLAIAQGGTGANTAAAARTALGAVAAGYNTDITAVKGLSSGSSSNVAVGPTGVTNTGIYFGGGSVSMAGTGTVVFSASASTTSSVKLGGDAGAQIGSTDAGVFIGVRAGYTATGVNNTCVGRFSAVSLTSGQGNIAVGAGVNVGSTSNFCVAVGHLASAGNGSNNIVIGHQAEVPNPSDSNNIVLGNSSISVIRAAVTTITALSDKRDKKNIRHVGSMLPFVNRLNPVYYTWNTRDGAKVGEEDVGFIAQDLLVAMEKESVDIPGLVDTANPDRLAVGQGKLLIAAIRAIQELSAEVDYLKTQVNGPY